MHADAITVVVDPGPETRPRLDERLVGDLDALCPGGQQPGLDEQVDDLAVDRRALRAARRAPSAVRGRCLRRARRGAGTAARPGRAAPAGSCRRPVRRFGRWLPAIDPGLAVGLERQLVAGPATPRLDQRVRDERQRPGVVGGFGNDALDQLGGDDETHLLGRFRDDDSQLLLAQRTHHDLPSGEQRRELGKRRCSGR